MITIYHNPACGTSRTVLALIAAAGHQPQVIEYLKTGWTFDQLCGLLAAMNAKARDILRDKGTPAAALGLLEDGVSDDTIIAAMLTHRILVNRPIVITPKATKLCRPSETVTEIL
jgi:arsenate reductase (glutaredoxin)